MRFAILFVVVPLGGHADASVGDPGRPGTLRISGVAHATRMPTPVRIELTQADGHAFLPEGLKPAPGSCPARDSSTSWWEEISGPSDLQSNFWVKDRVGDQKYFYSLGAPVELSLPAGKYRVRGFKGLEYHVAEKSIEIVAGRTTELALEMRRWINMPGEGWFSGDDHVHVSRKGPWVNLLLETWFAAEDLHVANLLEMGHHGGPIRSRQYAFGQRGLHRGAETWLASGQENPRTWLVGHAIILGADAYLDAPDAYLLHDRVWRQASDDGALAGYAHFGAPGVFLDLPEERIDFLEVVQFDLGIYDALYRGLNLGASIAPTAGTDYQCALYGPPGDVRFYARVDGPLNYRSWLEAVRAGRTFVTNGPMIEIDVGGAGAGETVVMEEPGSLKVGVSVRFDPMRDDVETLELVQDGRVLVSTSRRIEAGKMELRAEIDVAGGSWVAARTRGVKKSNPEGRASVSHSGIVRLVVSGQPRVPSETRRVASRESIAILDKLRGRLDELSGAQRLGQNMELRFGVTAEVLARDGDKLSERIQRSRDWYEANLRSPQPCLLYTSPSPRDRG